MITSTANKIIRVILTALLIVTAVYPFFSKPTNSAALTALSDTMSRQKTSENADHTVQFDLVTTWDATETIVVDFDNGFTSTGFANTEAEDFDITWEGAEKTIVANGSCAANSIEITTVDTTNDVFTFTLCSGSTASAATDTIVIEIGNHASAGGGGNDQIDNPSSTGSKTITITGPGVDTGSLAVPILSDDQVTVSATVDPTITSTISSITCTISPALTSTTVDSCSYTNQVATNAASGYASTLLEDGNLRTSGALTISDVGDGAVDTAGGEEEYGASTSSTNVGSQDIAVWDGACNLDSSDASENGSAITGTAKRYADHGGPVDETTTICHSATISSTTEAGSYSHIVTHITTGTF